MSIPKQLEQFADSILERQPLSQYSYMKVGGPADLVAIVRSKSGLATIINAARDAGIRYLIIGGGSNIVFSDAGFRGLIIVNRTNLCSIDRLTETVTAESGVPMNLLVNETTRAGLSGIESFLGIPGTVGGALFNNSHYMNQLIGDYVDTVELLSGNGRVHWEQRSYFNFGYDYSILQRTHETVLQVVFQLNHGYPEELQENAKAALEKRHKTQPLDMPSSGCIFQNFDKVAAQYPRIPAGITSAGALIDAAGLKGLKVGGAEVSQVHANFIVNTGNATCRDIMDLSNQIKTRIQDQYGILLKTEVFFMNENGERVA